MECVESVSLLSLPDDSSLATSHDAMQADNKSSTHRFSPRYVINVLPDIIRTNYYLIFVADKFCVTN